MVAPLVPLLILAGKAVAAAVGTSAVVGGAAKAKSVYDDYKAEDLKEEIKNIIHSEAKNYEDEVNLFRDYLENKRTDFEYLLTEVKDKVFNGIEPLDETLETIPEEWRNKLKRIEIAISHLQPHISKTAYSYLTNNKNISNINWDTSKSAFGLAKIHNRPDIAIAAIAAQYSPIQPNTAQYSIAFTKDCFNSAKQSSEYRKDAEEARRTIHTKINEMYDSFKEQKHNFLNEMELADIIIESFEDIVSNENYPNITTSKKAKIELYYKSLKDIAMRL